MVDSLDPKTNEKPPKRCQECDRIMEHYNEWLLPTNEMRVVCWECLARMEKASTPAADSSAALARA